MIVYIYNIYIIYIIFNISYIFCISKIIELDINKYKNINISENNNNNFFDKYYFSDIYINIELGSNKQKIPLFLFHSRYELSIGNSNTLNPFKFNDFK